MIGADDLGYRGIHEVENHLDGIDRRGQWQVIHKPTEDVVGSIIRDTSKFSEMDTREFHRELQDELVDAFGQTDVIRYSMDGNTVKAQRITYLSKEKSVEGESWEGIRVTSGPGNLDAWLAVAPQDKRQITTKEAEPFLEKIAEDTGIKPHWWDDNAGDLTVGDYPNALDREIIDV
ncbi:hypothetical protein [Halorhabdus tiamatea]|uniref:hypothetical protein n=1 Tax=Halorhabdus tiamatea TaxID=430914 RepID=UPI001268206F|nr:hypothetical protein [Halorhabdus tiamatea]